MNIRNSDSKFDNEIIDRIDNPDWNCQIVSWVFDRIKEERKNKIINIASIMFPILASAFLLLILKFSIVSDPAFNDDEDTDVYSMLNSTYSFSYDMVDYYMEMFVSQRIVE